MRKSLSLQLRQTIFSWQTLVTTLAGLIILIWYSIANWIQVNRFLGNISYSEVCGDFLKAIYDAHARTGFSLFAPVFAVIPCATQFCDDYNSGYIKSILLRMNIKDYIREKIINCSVAGGLTVFLPELICGGIFSFFGHPHVPSQYSSYLNSTIFSEVQYVWDGYLVFLLYLFFAFLFGAVWSNIGLCFSAYVPNRYITLAAPFALYYSIHLTLNRSGFLAMYSPASMLQPTSILFPNIAFPIAYQLLLFSFAIVMFIKKIKRRIQNV